MSAVIGCGYVLGGMYERMFIDIHFTERSIEIGDLMELGE
jgi:hypothetical protein